MTRRKQGLGLFGLLVVAALGVMAFAASAQAVVPKFNLNGSTADFNVTGTQEGSGTLLVKNSNLNLICNVLEVNKGLVLTGGLVADAKLLYKECKAFDHTTGKELPCHVSDVDANKPELLHVSVLEATLLPIEFADKTYGVLAEKLVIFVNFLKGTGCALPLKSEIHGEVCFKITSGNGTVTALIASSEAIQKECPERKTLEDLAWPSAPGVKDELLYGINPAYVIGSANLSDADGAAGSIGVLLL